MIGYVILYSALIYGALSDTRIALIGCVLIGSVVGVMFVGGLIVCISDMYNWMRNTKRLWRINK